MACVRVSFRLETLLSFRVSRTFHLLDLVLENAKRASIATPKEAA